MPLDLLNGKDYSEIASDAKLQVCNVVVSHLTLKKHYTYPQQFDFAGPVNALSGLFWVTLRDWA